MTRVNSYAQNVSGYTINDWLGGRQWSQALNDEFIETMMAQGRDFIDIGPDFGGDSKTVLTLLWGVPRVLFMAGNVNNC